MKPVIKIHGFGYVGTKTYEMFKNHALIAISDTSKPFVPSTYIESKDSSQFDFEFICVPTPCGADSNCDISYVVQALESTQPQSVVIIKSTVSIGTCDTLQAKYKRKIVFNPEFVGQSSYDSTYDFHTNMVKTPWIVLGGDNDALDAVYYLYLPVVGAQKKFYFLTAREAELVKYMENSFFAMKVIFSNEMFDIAKTFNCDWKRVREAWLADTRINPMHTAVFPENRGFGGKCFPKDTSALLKTCEEAGYSPRLLKAMIEVNNDLRDTRNSEN